MPRKPEKEINIARNVQKRKEEDEKGNLDFNVGLYTHTHDRLLQ